MAGSAYAEYIRRKAQNSAQMAGTTTPYVTEEMLASAAQDLTGQENAIASQRQIAEQLRGNPMPEGRTVGPSGIYVGPNWGEVLGHAAEQFAGGYENAKANQADTALEEARLKKALAQEQIAQGRHQQDVDIDTDRATGQQLYQSEQLASAEAERTARENFQNQQLQLQRDTLAEAKRRNMEDASIDRIIAEAKRDANGTDAPLKVTERNNEMKDLRKDLTGVSEMQTAFSHLDETMRPYLKGGAKAVKGADDIPGLGRWSGKDDALGFAGRAYERFAEGGDPDAIFQAARSIANVKLREGAGLSQTKAEIERLKQVMEGEFGSDPEQIFRALNQVYSTMQDDLSIMRDTYHPQVLKEYGDNAGDRNALNYSLQPWEFEGADAPVAFDTGQRGRGAASPPKVEQSTAPVDLVYDTKTKKFVRPSQ